MRRLCFHFSSDIGYYSLEMLTLRLLASNQFDLVLAAWFSCMAKSCCDNRRIRRRKRFASGIGGEERRGKKESQNFLTDDLHPSRENRTAKPLVCSFFRHVSSPCCQTTDSARSAPLSLSRRSSAALLHLHSKFSLLFHNFIHFSCQP